MFSCQALCLQGVLAEGAQLLHHLCKVRLCGTAQSTQRAARGHIQGPCLKVVLAQGPGHSLLRSLPVTHRP